MQRQACWPRCFHSSIVVCLPLIFRKGRRKGRRNNSTDPEDPSKVLEQQQQQQQQQQPNGVAHTHTTMDPENHQAYASGYETDASTVIAQSDASSLSDVRSAMSADDETTDVRDFANDSQQSVPLLFQNSVEVLPQDSSSQESDGTITDEEIQSEGSEDVGDVDVDYSPDGSVDLTEEDFVMYDVDDIRDVPQAFNLRNRLRFVYQSNIGASDSSDDTVGVDSVIDATIETRSLYNSKLMSLPDEVLDIVLRYLSSNPRSSQPLWESQNHMQNAINFSLSCQRIFNLFRVRLISLRTTPERYREDLLYEPPTAGAVVDARAPGDIEKLCTMLRIAGPALQELLITKSLPRNSWVDSFVTHVNSLRKLSLRDVNAEYPLEFILEKCTRTLRELEIVGATGMALSESQLHAMATHCSSLKSLALRLSMFEFDWTPVWMGVGPGLVNLSLGATRFWIMDTEETQLLQQIGMYCADLKKLHFYHLGPTLGNACATLCARYGEQLENLELEQSQILRPDIQTLISACPTTKFSISHGSSLFSHSYNVDVIDFLGPNIKSLRYRSQLAHDESLLQVGEKCKGLLDLRLDCASTLTERALESILKGTAGTLKTISLSFFVRGLDRALVSSALFLLAKFATKLEEIQIGGQKFNMEAFGKLMEKCKSTIRKVGVTFGFRTAGEREVVDIGTLVSVVKCVYIVENIKSLVIIDRTSSEQYHNNNHLRQACYPLRKRIERITVCGFDYIR